MSTTFIDEYLVKLGATVDASGMQRFHQALREASVVADLSAASIAGAFLKAQTEIVGGFVAIGTAALGLVDKVAMADQQYRLFALHMYMSKDAARGLKVAMDALGEPLENLTWDKELRDRTHQLLVDQKKMAPAGDFDGQMRKIRDIRFEFTRMEVEVQYLGMHVVQDFMKALGYGPDQLLGTLRKFNDWITTNLPAISAQIVTTFLPVWKDTKDVLLATGEALAACGVAFTNIIGAMTGDKSIQGTTFDFDKFAGALIHVVHWLALFAELVDKVVEGVADLAAGLGNLFSSIPAPLLDAAIGGVVGGVAGGPLGALAGAAGGAALGAFGSGPNHSSVLAGTAPKTSSVNELVSRYADNYGIDRRLAAALVAQESGGNPNAVSATGAMGVMQLTRGTAKGLGVDRSDTNDNVRGGMSLFAHLLQRYHDAPTAIAAYHEGETKMDKILAGRATLSSEARGEVASVMRRTGATGDLHIGSIVVHVDKPNAINEDVGKVVAARVRATQDKNVQRNLAEFQGLSWGY